MARFLIVGATGFIGSKIAAAILKQQHECVVVSRARTKQNAAILDELEASGAHLLYHSPDDVTTMTSIMDGVDVVICAMGEGGIYGKVEYALLEAAISARVKRFIPNEFGLDTLALPKGVGALFDEKKQFQEVLKESSMPFTIIFNGGAFEYFLPNLQYGDKIITYGDDYDVSYYTHSRDNLGAITVMAAFDPRCENKFIALKKNLVTQREVLDKLKAFYPDYPFQYQKISKEEFMDGTHEVKTAIWINGHCGRSSPNSLDAAELFPDYKFLNVDDALRDRAFVFNET